MSKRHNQILAGLLALQLVLAAVVFWPRSAASGGERQLLLGDLQAGDVVALTIEDNDGKRIRLAQSAGEWVLPDAGDFPVTVDKVTALLDKLVTVDTARLVTRTEASHKRLQVARDDFERRIELTTAAGDLLVLYLGSSPSYGAVHVRLQSANETYLTDKLSSWDVNATASSWIDAAYVQLAKEDVQSITVRNDQGTLNIIKDAEGNWTLPDLAADEQVNSSVISSLAGRAISVSMLTPLGKENQDVYGLSAPRATVTIQTADQTITWVVGAKFPEDNSYVIKSSASPYYVRVNEFSVKDLLEKTRADLIQPPATPTPEAGG